LPPCCSGNPPNGPSPCQVHRAPSRKRDDHGASFTPADVLAALNRLQEQLGSSEPERPNRRWISRLPERQKLVIALKYFENLTNKEIAEVLGTSPLRVSVLERQALMQLGGDVEPNRDPDDDP
jgi:RNA polymerase sigma factor (sigma-70 family)